MDHVLPEFVVFTTCPLISTSWSYQNIFLYMLQADIRTF